MKYSFGMRDVGIDYLNYIRNSAKKPGDFSIAEDSSTGWLVISLNNWKYSISTFDREGILKAYSYFLSRKMIEEKWYA